jgi:hypothetical protein
MGDHNKITIIFIINGVDVAVEANLHAPLATARNHALEQSGNTGRPVDDWVIRDEKGVTLPPEQKVERFNFANGLRLFLMPAVGAGG